MLHNSTKKIDVEKYDDLHREIEYFEDKLKERIQAAKLITKNNLEIFSPENPNNRLLRLNTELEHTNLKNSLLEKRKSSNLMQTEARQDSQADQSYLLETANSQNNF